MPVFDFLWFDENEQHLAEHGVTKEEFEEVVFNAARSEIQRSRSSGNPLVVGYTSTGKKIACVYEDVDGYQIVPVTAYEVE